MPKELTCDICGRTGASETYDGEAFCNYHKDNTLPTFLFPQVSDSVRIDIDGNTRVESIEQNALKDAKEAGWKLAAIAKNSELEVMRYYFIPQDRNPGEEFFAMIAMGQEIQWSMEVKG